MEQPSTVQEPVEQEEQEQEVDFLADVEAADPESFNVCISCD